MRPATPACLLFAAALLAAGPRMAAQEELTFNARVNLHLRCLVSPRGLLLSGAAAGINQWRDHPWEWGQGAAGYGRRYAYRTARHGAKHGIEFGAGELLGEDPRYHRSAERGFWRRTRYAVAHTFIARGRDGEDRFAFARMAFDLFAREQEQQACQQRVLEDVGEVAGVKQVTVSEHGPKPVPRDS